MHSIYKQGNLPYLSVKACPNCEQILPLNVDYCPSCSYNFTSRTMEASLPKIQKTQPVQQAPVFKNESNEYAPQQQTAVAEAVNNTVVQPELVVKKEKVIFCDNCGAKIIGSQKYCGGCGAKVSKRICPSCEQIVDANLTFCPLCGEKLQEPNSNVTQVNTPVTNQVVQPVQQFQPVQQQPAGYNGQPINIYLNPNSLPINQNDTNTQAVLVNQEPETSETEERVEEVVENKYNGINMGRKRLFLIIQLLLVGVIAAIMVMVPILTKDTFFSALIPCITGTSSESLVSGKGIFAYVMEIIDKKTIVLNNSSVLYPMIKGENGKLLFTGIPFVYTVLGWISSSPDSLAVTVSMIIVLFVYALITIAMLIAILTSFIGLFVRKPYRGKTLGFLLISLLIGSIFIYINSFFEGFKQYDSWLIYAFAICFFVWIVVKIVFGKEAKLYKENKEQKAMQKEMEKE